MKHVLVIGEESLDVFLRGTVERISPEAPVLVLKEPKATTNPGMAANVVANIQSLAPDWHIDFFHQARPIHKIRHVDEVSGYHLLRTDIGDTGDEGDVAGKLADIIKTQFEQGTRYDAVVISDYQKAFLTAETISFVAAWAKNQGIPCFLDTKLILGEWSHDVTFVKINNKEFNAQLAAGVKNPWAQCENLIVTKGKDGSDLYDRNGNIIHHVDTPDVNVFDLAGAGDSYLAGLVVRYLEVGDIEEAMTFASKAAGVAVSKRGVVAVKREEVV
jgi:bifunctional ADP-heptose synthase (sugar kinase/adenylyltransferase)